MKKFDTFKERVDVFSMALLAQKAEFKNPEFLIQILLILSHGNRNLERDFSINKACLMVNQK